MKETFGEYLVRLQDRRTEDDYKYTNEDFKKYIYYIYDCYERNISVYKCLELMYFAERKTIEDLFNRQPTTQHNFLPGFIHQFDPENGELNDEEWSATRFLKWLELNEFKIIK